MGNNGGTGSVLLLFLLLSKNHQLTVNYRNFSREGYDAVILSDLLHFKDSHDLLVPSVADLMVKSPGSRMHVSVRFGALKSLKGQ